MNVERFAGDNPMMKQFAFAMQQNAALGKARTKQAQDVNTKLTERYVAAAYGKI